MDVRERRRGRGRQGAGAAPPSTAAGVAAAGAAAAPVAVAVPPAAAVGQARQLGYAHPAGGLLAPQGAQNGLVPAPVTGPAAAAVDSATLRLAKRRRMLGQFDVLSQAYLALCAQRCEPKG
jgi:hypothetical protein